MAAIGRPIRVGEVPLLAYAVEKLISEAHATLHAYAKAAENPQ
jgi:hypothetical protein